MWLVREKEKVKINKLLQPKIVYQTKEFMVLSKPVGWVVNSATTIRAPVVQEWLQDRREELGIQKVDRAGIVHRLDKDTSGALIVAKTMEAFFDLQRQFKEREVKKTYVALVHGRVKEKSGVVDAPVGRLPWNRERFGVLSGGREAVTKYKVRGYYRLPDENSNDAEFSYLEVKPVTGRTHQIRIHLKHIGHSIVADTFYAGRKTSRRDLEWCPRLFLHAGGIVFKDIGGKDVRINVELPLDLNKALHSLEKMR